jgi:hypothetical protein
LLSTLSIRTSVVGDGKGRCASQTEYAPKHYTLARTNEASRASPKAANGVNDAAKTANNAPKAPNLRCKLAELVKLGLAIGSPSLTGLSLSKYLDQGRPDFCCFF